MLVAVIDDNAVNLKVYVNVISHIPGIQTKTFQSSADGLAWCKDNEPDLLVLDYHMPPPDGIEFIKRYRTVRPAAPRVDSSIRYAVVQDGQTISIDSRVRSGLRITLAAVR